MKVTKRSDRLRANGASAVFVTFDPPDVLARSMLADVDCPWPVLVDRPRVTYEAWGLGRTSLAGIWLDPSIYRQYGRLLYRGERIRAKGRDTRQLGGDFVIDGQGRVRYSRPQRRDDRPPVGELVDVVEEAST